MVHFLIILRPGAQGRGRLGSRRTPKCVVWPRDAAVRKPLRIRYRATTHGPACLMDVPNPLPWYPTVSDVRCARGDLLTYVARRSPPTARWGGGLAQEHIYKIFIFQALTTRFFVLDSWFMTLLSVHSRQTSPVQSTRALGSSH